MPENKKPRNNGGFLFSNAERRCYQNFFSQLFFTPAAWKVLM